MPLDLTSLGVPPQIAQAIQQQQQPTGLMDRATSLISNPAVQAALAGYLGLAGTPRYEGMGGAIAHGGLGALSAFNQARQLQLQQPLAQARALEEYGKLGKEIPEGQLAGEKAQAYKNIGKADPGQAQASLMGYGSAYYKSHDAMAQIKLANQDIAGQFAMRHPDQIGQGIAAEIAASPKAVSLADVERAYSEAAQNPDKLAKLHADLQASELRPSEIRANIGRAEAGTSAARTAADVNQAKLDEYRRTGSFTPPPPAIEYGPGGQTRRTRSLTPDPGMQFRDPSGILGKVNTDLGRFASTNPIHFYTGTDAWVKDATSYALSQNPNADPEQVKAAAAALARQPTTTPSPKAPSGGVHEATHQVKLKDGSTVNARLGTDGKYYPVK